MKRIPRQLDYRLLAQSSQPTGIPVTELQLRQLADARYACQQAAAALLCLAAGAADPTLESEAKRLQSVLSAAADELGDIIRTLRLAP